MGNPHQHHQDHVSQQNETVQNSSQGGDGLVSINALNNDPVQIGSGDALLGHGDATNGNFAFNSTHQIA